MSYLLQLQAAVTPEAAVVTPEAKVFLYLMGGLAVWGLYELNKGVWSRSKAFRRAARRLKSKSYSPKIDPFGRAPSELKELWSSFVELYHQSRVEIDGKAIATTRPEDVFTQHAVLGRHNRNLSMALAGVFAGLGILGTFVGLFVGLRGIDTSGQDELLTSVQTLLAGMSTAFLSSLCGISLSLIWLFVDRSSLNRLRRRVSAFFIAVSYRFPICEPETILLEGLSSAADQRAILRNLGTDLASAFQEALSKSFSSELSPALESIDETLRTVSTSVDQRQAAALDEMVGAFREQLLEATGEQFDQLTTAIEGAAQWQERVNDDVQAVFTRVTTLSEVSTELIENSRQAAEHFLESLGGLRESHDRIAAVTRDLHEIADLTAATSIGLSDQAAVFTNANTELREALSAQLDSVTGQVDRLAGFWGELREHLDGLATSLGSSLTEFTSLTQEKLQEIFARFDSEMASIVEHLSGTLADLREATEELLPGVQRVEAALSESLAPIKSSEKEIAGLTESVRALGSLPTSLAQAAEEARATQEAMTRLSKTIERVDGGRKRPFGLGRP